MCVCVAEEDEDDETKDHVTANTEALIIRDLLEEKNQNETKKNIHSLFVYSMVYKLLICADDCQRHWIYKPHINRRFTSQ